MFYTTEDNFLFTEFHTMLVVTLKEVLLMKICVFNCFLNAANEIH